jgi:hypothetical protein
MKIAEAPRIEIKAGDLRVGDIIGGDVFRHVNRVEPPEPGKVHLTAYFATGGALALPITSVVKVHRHTASEHVEEGMTLCTGCENWFTPAAS